MSKRLLVTGLLLSLAFYSFAQTPGLIFKSAGTGALVLDPNGDGYTSISTNGFITNDQSESEIPFKPLVVPAVEPVADPGPGPDCGFTDIVDSGVEDPVFTYLDANGNLLYRFRLGNAATNSKGYSILIDTDQKFGSSGPNADPNAVSGNPGFEIEIVLRTNFNVSLYDVNGTSTPVLKTDTLSYAKYAQKSIALTTNCGNADYFYDFYIPFSVITANFPGITTSTPLRIVAVTSMSPAPAIGNSAVSDVGGIDDQAYGYNFDNIFQTIIDNYTPTAVTGIARDRSACPVITSPVGNSATSISGTSTEIGAIIKVYKGIAEPLTLIGTATVGAGGTWVAGVTAITTGEVISASATNTNEGESYYSCSQVTVTNCSSPFQPYNLVREANRKYISGNATPGATIKVYVFTTGSYVQQTGSFTLDPSGDGTFCWVPGLSTNTCTPPNGSGALVNGTTYYVTQTVTGCESSKAAICVDNQVSVTPTVTQTSLYTTTTSISGTSGSGAAITIYANGTSIATTTAVGTSWTATVNLSAQGGKYISVGAVDGTKCMAIPLTAAILVTTAPTASATPTVTGTYCGTSTGSTITATGTSTEGNGTTITVYVGGIAAGTTTVFSGKWSEVIIVKGGDIITATAMATGKSVSSTSGGVTVNTSGAAPAVTFTTPIIEGSSSLSGSYSGSGTLKIYIDGTLLASTSANSFTITGLNAFDLYAGGILKATLTSGGCESASTSGVTVDCNAPSAALAVSPANTFVCLGSTTTVTLSAAQNGIIYQLYNGATPTGSSRLGTGADLVLTSGTLTSNATLTVRAVKISSVSCTSTLTQTQIVTVTPLITGNTAAAPATATFCQTGDPDKITGSLPGGGNGTYTYQWQSSIDNLTYNTVPGATDKDYDPGILTQTTYFKRMVASATCQSMSPAPAIITIENTSITNSISPTASISFTDSGIPAMDGNNSGSVTYTWQSSADNITFTNTGITSEDYPAAAPIISTTYYRRITSNGSCSAISNVITYSVNHTPSVSSFTKTGTEDQNINFTSADFTGPYSDPDNNPLTQIRIESVSPNGTLYSGATTLIAGSIVTLADLSTIVFFPTSNYNGSTTFTWKGFDGLAYSTSPSTVTMTIAPINDAPSAGNKSVSAVEDVIYAFSASDFNSTYSDPEGNIFAGLRITSLETAGALKLNGVDIALNEVVSAADLASSLLTFTPALNANGNAYATFTFEVWDGSDYSASGYTLTVNVGAVNDAPTAGNSNITVTEDVTYQFSTGDFNTAYLDEEGNAFSGIRITGLETAGSLKLNGIDIAVNDIVSSAALTSSLLTFTPSANATGSNYATFTFSVSDGATFSTASYTLTIDITPVNDSPTGGSNSITASEDAGYVFAVADFNVAYTDNESEPFDGIRIITLPATGILKINNVDVAINTIISATDLNASLLTFTPAPDANGNAYTTFTFKVFDGSLYSSADYTLTINVSAVNDSPSFTKGADQNHLTNAGPITVNAWATDISAGPSNEAGQVVTFTVTNDNNSLFSVQPDIDEATGNLTYVIAPAVTGTASVNVRLSDNGGLLNGGSDVSPVLNFTINVSSAANTPPAATDATVNIDENSANSVPVHTVIASDGDGNVLSYTITAGNPNGAFAINNATGVITVADAAKLDYEVTTQYVLTVRVSDGINSDNATITININDLNDNIPAASDATVSLNENTANGSGVHTVIATDADGSPLTYTITGGNPAGAFSISASGTITVADVTKLDFETLTQFVLTVRVSDGVSSVDVTITVNINNLNDNVPVANDATVSINENAPDGTPVHTVVATDPDGNLLAYTITNGNAAGVFSIDNTGSITIADATKLDYEISKQFVLTVNVSDGTSHDDAMITVNLDNLNDNAPVANSATISLNENTVNSTSVHTVIATDADDNTLTYSITNGNTSGAFSISNAGLITVTDATKLDYETSPQFVLTVNVSDGARDDDAIITINLSNLNDNTPVANDATVSLSENTINGTAVHTVIATDDDGNPLTYSITNGNTSGAFSVNSTGLITVADGTKLDYETLAQFVLIVNVSDGASDDDAIITINLNNLNDNMPVANGVTLSLNENAANSTLVHNIVATDADGSPLTYSITGGNSSGAFSINNTGTISVADASKLDYEVITQFVLTVNVSDGGGGDDAIVTINLNDLNDNAPVASDASIFVDEHTINGTSIYNVIATDGDGSPLTYSITNGNSSGAFSITNTGSITVSDAAKLDYETITQFILTVYVSDGVTSDDAIITVNLNDLNDNTPLANDGTVSLDENTGNGTPVHAVIATDADGNALTYSITNGNTTGAFSIGNTGEITVADATKLDYETLAQFVLTVRVSDGATYDDAIITININDRNDNAPVAASATVSLDENASNGTPVHTVIATDGDGSTLTYVITNGNTSGAFSIDNSGVITVAGASMLDYETVTQFVLTVNVSDGVSSDIATVTINLNDLNDNSPVANDASVSLDENVINGTAVHTLVATDADGSPLTYAITNGNATGAFSISNTGTITVTDATKLDYETLQQFIVTVTVSDGIGSDDAIVTINLNNLNDNAPDAADATVSIDENAVNETIVHTIPFSDADGSAVTFAIDGGNGSGAFSIDPVSGVITVKDQNAMDFETTNQFTLTITLTDGSNFKTVTITINVNDLPDLASTTASLITATPASVVADGTTVSYITIQLKDINGNNLTTSGGTVEIFTTVGTCSIASNLNNGTYEATIVSSVTGTATITATLNGVAIADNAEVSFTAGPISPATTQITASANAILANGVSTTVITVLAKDANGNLIPSGGSLLVLSTTLGTLTNVVDHGDGTYTATLTSSSTAGPALITGTADGLSITDSENVDFTTGSASASTSTISSALPSISADGIATTTITVQVRDISGNLLTTGGDVIALASTAGTISNIVDQGNGTYTATLTSSTDAVIAVVTGTVNGVPLSDTAEIEFIAGPVLVLSASINASIATIPADGLSTSTIEVVITDQNNNPVSGLTLNASTTAGILADFVDNNDGSYTIILTSSTTPGDAVVTVSIEGITETQTITVVFTSVPPAFFIPEGFSPDGDGVNDAFIIQGAENYTVSLKVYNRWGDIVFEHDDYKNDWQGEPNRGIVLGQKLPDGTYFYALDLNNGQKPLVRYFTIKRR